MKGNNADRATDMTFEMARALCEAGYMSVADYAKLCQQNGWIKWR